MTAAVTVMILVAMGFANTFLDARMAENEFSTNKQFMLTTGPLGVPRQCGTQVNTET